MSNLTFDFSSRTAIVTGAARGIGLEIARHLHAAGATVYALDYDAEEIALVAKELGFNGLGVDVSDTEAVESAVATAVKETGRIDIVVNNAGVLRDAMVWKITDEDWNAVIDIHLGGTFRLTRAVVPHFRKQSFGRIINVTSYTGLHGNPGQANYSAAKAGIVGLTLTSAKELARFGVTVNAISPNAETRMIESIPAERRAGLEATIPLGRFAAPSEMCAAVAFFASDEAGYITGTVLPVDGGIAM